MNCKKISGFCLVLLLLVTNSLYAQPDTLMVVGGEGNPGSTGNIVSIHLINTVDVAGIQFVLTDTPNVLTITNADPTDRTTDFTLNVQDNNTSINVLLFDVSGRTIAPGSGAIIELMYEVDATATTGSVSLELSGVIVSDTMAQQIPVVQVDSTFLVTSTDVINMGGKVIPSNFNLFQNYPNPFNPATTIEYHLPQSVEVVLTIYDLQGHTIQRYAQGIKTAGCHSVTWDGRDERGQAVASGIYFYRIEMRVKSGGHRLFVNVRKMIFMK